MIALVLVLVIIGVLLQAMKTYIAIDPMILMVIHLVILVAVVYCVLAVFGIADLPLPRAR